MDLKLRNFSRPFKSFLIAFLVVLSTGYFTGLAFVNQTESTHPSGIVENYNGNEENELAKVMKFKKGKREMLTIVHTHVLSIGFIFLCMGVLLWGTELSTPWKLFLTIEPFCSILLTFGGIYMIWLDIAFMSYVVMLSGILMTVSFILSLFFILNDLRKPPL